MSGRAEPIFDKLTFDGNAETAIDTSYYLVKRGTDLSDVVETAANTDYPVGRANHKQNTVGGAVQCQPLLPGQQLKFISDGTIDGSGQLLMPSAVVAGRVAKATPAAGEVIIGRSAEAQATANRVVMVDTLSPFRYAAT